MSESEHDLMTLDPERAPWERVFTVAPLVVIGTVDADGRPDLAPKHLAQPMSWGRHFGFVCSETHGTLINLRRTGVFTVSYPSPSQVVLASLAASPRCDDGTKPIVDGIPTTPARHVDCVLLRDAYLQLECELHRTVEELDTSTLVIGRVVAARARSEYVRSEDVDEQAQLRDHPVLAYLAPGRFAELGETRRFPLPAGMKR